MTYMPRVAAATTKWRDLAAELDRWEEAGRIARLWWRDDDAVAPTPQLDRLLEIARGTPLALAVIPQPAEPVLAERLADQPQVAVLQHGWRHANHATTGKKNEYPAERAPADVAAEIAAGRDRLATLFGGRALPVFVPPWNRFADQFAPLLAAAGITVLSQQAPRATKLPTGIAALDVHLDVVDWHHGGGFVGSDAALGRLVAELRAQRATGDESAIGVMTHHLVMDGATEDFLACLLATIAEHKAARWAAMPELVAAA
jgi:peptidoglycan/xylan/chitin deacetylase (PgdA/CDA1 family)